MNKKLIKIIGLLVTTLVFFWIPLIRFNSQSFYINQILQFKENTAVFAVFLTIFCLFFIIVAVSIFIKNHYVLNALFSVSFLLMSVIIFIAPIIFSKNAIDLEKGGILFGICLGAYFLYFASCSFAEFSLTIEDIVEIGLFVAFAFILDLPIFKFKVVPNGGSISFSMVPLIIICLRKDFLKSFVAVGIVFGLTDCLIDGYGLITFPFDYLLGFGSLAIVSLFRYQIIKDNKLSVKSVMFLIIGLVLAMAGRVLASTISGILIYKLQFIPSLIYQLTYIGPSAGLALAAIIILYKPLLIINKRLSNV